MVMDCQQCTEDMQGLMEVKGLTRSQILDKALRDYERFGSRNRKIDSKLPPKVERWGKLYSLLLSGALKKLTDQLCAETDEGLALYRRGALRMTRTPGRKASRQRNCISLEDLIKPKSMLGMYSNTFFLEFDFLAPLLPILNHPHSTRPVPVRSLLVTLSTFSYAILLGLNRLTLDALPRSCDRSSLVKLSISIHFFLTLAPEPVYHYPKIRTS
jgi:hypothetical protein